MISALRAGLIVGRYSSEAGMAPGVRVPDDLVGRGYGMAPGISQLDAVTDRRR